MKFIDEIILTACSGSGGDGAVRWRRTRSNAKGGPAGGDGGKGGDVFLRGVRDIGRLSKYVGTKKFVAKNGEGGGDVNRHGVDGKDVTIDVPVGSLVRVVRMRGESGKDGGEVVEILDESVHKIISGGRGGYGNTHFKSSKNVTPTESTKGKKGECVDLDIELQLIADAGFIGLPNAGKTSLLNTLTRAGARVGDYEFTTLDPNLGEFFGYVLADIPGLIEGASLGKGLGFKFLKHIKRTNILLHCISSERGDISSIREVVLKELKQYDYSLSDKLEIVILTKSDIGDSANIERAISELKADGIEHVFVTSVEDKASIKNLQDSLISLLRSLPK